jgi:site-specific recombinase XerD
MLMLQGKGGKDRCVLMVSRVLELLQAYWRRQRHAPRCSPPDSGQLPLSLTSLQKTVKAVVRQSGMAKETIVLGHESGANALLTDDLEGRQEALQVACR